MSDYSQCNWNPDLSEAYCLFRQHCVQCTQISKIQDIFNRCPDDSESVASVRKRNDKTAEDSSGRTSAIDPALKTPGLQNMNQVTVRELYESSKRAKERNDKAAAEKRQEKKKRAVQKRIERGKEELSFLEDGLSADMKAAATNGTWASIRREVGENCVALLLTREWAKAWEVPGVQVLWIERMHSKSPDCIHGKSLPSKYFRVGSMKQRDCMECATYFIVYRKPGFLERLLENS